MARAIINNAIPKQLSEVKVRKVTFDIENLAAQVEVESLYDDGTSEPRRTFVKQTRDGLGPIDAPTLDGIRDFFLVFRTATSLNDMEVKTLEFFLSELGDVTVEA